MSQPFTSASLALRALPSAEHDANGASESEEEIVETAQEKKIRLAKELIAQLKAEGNIFTSSIGERARPTAGTRHVGCSMSLSAHLHVFHPPSQRSLGMPIETLMRMRLVTVLRLKCWSRLAVCILPLPHEYVDPSLDGKRRLFVSFMTLAPCRPRYSLVVFNTREGIRLHPWTCAPYECDVCGSTTGR